MHGHFASVTPQMLGSFLLLPDLGPEPRKSSGFIPTHCFAMIHKDIFFLFLSLAMSYICFSFSTLSFIALYLENREYIEIIKLRKAKLTGNPFHTIFPLKLKL